MATITTSARRCGKTAAADRAAGLSIDAYRELMTTQHEQLEAWKALNPGWDQPIRRLTLADLWRDYIPLEPDRSAFLREFLGDFQSPPELVGPVYPTFEVWERSQRARAHAARVDALLRGDPHRVRFEWRDA